MARRPANISHPIQSGSRSGRLLRCVRRSAGLLIMVLLFAHAAGRSLAQAETHAFREYQVKAAFLYSIAKFVDWQAIRSGASSPNINVAILGQDPFGDSLDSIRGKTVKGRSLAIRHFRRIEEVRDCDVVFICLSEKKHLAQILKQLQNVPVLTVADHEGFCEAGGMINLVTSRNKIIFEINVAAARRARLTISSQLLKLARIVVE